MANEEGNLRINGKEYDPSDMTFREQREMRRILSVEMFPEEKNLDFEELTLADLLPAMIVVLARRDTPEFTLDEALDMKQKDVYIEASANGKKAPPTSRGSSTKSTSATRGAQN